jgi:hypothetical protein
MKPRIISAALSCLATGLLVAAPAPSDSVGTITTSFGRSYENCRVCQVDPDGVVFVHQKGVAKILFAELAEPLRTKLGYDAQKASDYVKEKAEKKQRAQELRAELQKEMIKAQAAVTVAEAQNAGMMQQAAAMGGGFMGFPGLTGGLYGWDNALWNGGSFGGNGNYGAGWNGACYGTPGGMSIRSNSRCAGPLLNVYSTNRGACIPSPLNRVRPANNFFAVPPLRVSTPAISVGVHGSAGRR